MIGPPSALPDAKVLIASGYMPDTEMNSLLQQGIHGVIMKPYSMRELAAKLEEILRDNASL